MALHDNEEYATIQQLEVAPVFWHVTSASTNDGRG